VPAYAQNRGFSRPAGHYFSIGCTFLRPLSRGTISLRSDDPSALPVIQPEFLSAPVDIVPMVAGIKLCRKLSQASPFDPFRGEEVDPGADVQSDEAIVEYLRAFSMTVDHPVGTCKMGADTLAVVDANLRVRGIEGLRVVDASIMPTVVSGNTNAPVIMIAEKAADMIKGNSPSKDR
jgi:choline dehydrogenase